MTILTCKLPADADEPCETEVPKQDHFPGIAQHMSQQKNIHLFGQVFHRQFTMTYFREITSMEGTGNSDTEAKRCFATHDEDESWLDECRKIVYIQSHAYIFNSSTLFNNVPMAQWSTLMPCNREAACSNLSGVLALF